MSDLIDLKSPAVRTGLNILLKDRATGRNIILATDAYEGLDFDTAITRQLLEEEAALNALCFCALRTLTETLRLTGALPGVFRCHLQADFSRSGTEALLEGIVGLRLGSLIPTMALMGSVYLRSRRQYAPDGRTAALS